MNLTSNHLLATAGLCAATAGTIFIGVQIGHPPADVAHLVTSEMTVRETAKAVMAALALVGLTGMLARHHSRLGIVGLAGYALLAVGLLAMFATQCIVGYVLPAVAQSDPGYVQDVLDAAMGETPTGDIGQMQTLLLAMGLGYPLGGLLFGIAVFRARVLSRWAGLLLAYGTVSVLALAALPPSFDRPFAVPTGLALVGLGLALWHETRQGDRPRAAAPAQDIAALGSSAS